MSGLLHSATTDIREEEQKRDASAQAAEAGAKTRDAAAKPVPPPQCQVKMPCGGWQKQARRQQKERGWRRATTAAKGERDRRKEESKEPPAAQVQGRELWVPHCVVLLCAREHARLLQPQQMASLELLSPGRPAGGTAQGPGLWKKPSRCENGGCMQSNSLQSIKTAASCVKADTQNGARQCLSLPRPACLPPLPKPTMPCCPTCLV